MLRSKYPQLCEEEMAVFTRELGTYAQRLATIANGDAVCTTFIPISTIPPAETRQPTRPTPTSRPPGDHSTSAAPAALRPYGTTADQLDPSALQ